MDDRRRPRSVERAPIDALRAILQIETATAAGVSGGLPPAKRLYADLRRESRLGVHVDEEQTAVGLISFGASLSFEERSQPAAAIAISTRATLLPRKRRREIGAAVLAWPTNACGDAEPATDQR